MTGVRLQRKWRIVRTGERRFKRTPVLQVSKLEIAMGRVLSHPQSESLTREERQRLDVTDLVRISDARARRERRRARRRGNP